MRKKIKILKESVKREKIQKEQSRETENGMEKKKKKKEKNRREQKQIEIEPTKQKVRKWEIKFVGNSIPAST